MDADAAVLETFNEPLRIARREVPAPEPGAVIADVLYGGICGTDAHLHTGNMAIPIPVVLGHEAVGKVAALGAGRTHDSLGQPLRPGDSIGWASNIACAECAQCRSGEVTMCERRRVYGINQSWNDWPHLSGGWASSIYLQPGTTLVKLPPGIDPVEVIALGCAGPTVVNGFTRVPTVHRKAVVVQGAGPVGIAAALFARKAGARQVVIIGGPTERIALAKELGVADAYLDLETEPESTQRVLRTREIIGSAGADVVFECTGAPPAVAEGIELCRQGGTYLVLGQYTDRGPTEINPHLITRKQLTVTGSWAFSGENYLTYVQALPELIELADLRRLVEVFPLAAANDALDRVKAGTVLKAALAPSKTPQGAT